MARRRLAAPNLIEPDMQAQTPHPIAIDGPAASGKSTLARALVERFGYALLDTGLMYRAVALGAVRNDVGASEVVACVTLAQAITLQIPADDRQARVVLRGEDVTDALREPTVERAVSQYAAIAEVRRVLVARQREFAQQQPSVLVGRDIGTVVLPDAPVKLFLEAPEGVRAQRRGEQAAQWGERQTSHEAGRDISGRDTSDRTRAASPLVEADDAIVIDTAALDASAMIARAISAIGERTS